MKCNNNSMLMVLEILAELLFRSVQSGKIICQFDMEGLTFADRATKWFLTF